MGGAERGWDEVMGEWEERRRGKEAGDWKRGWRREGMMVGVA